MTEFATLQTLPADLPVPSDDGAANHLGGMRLPSIPLASTSGRLVDLAGLQGRSVVYCYPRTGRPGEAPTQGWDDIPGARGCTPQSCGFRDHWPQIRSLSAQVFGLSTQTTEYQREAVERLQLPFELLSDAGLSFANALHLPTFEVEGQVRLKRLTLILHDGVIEHVFYPVFPPDKNAEEVIAWLSRQVPDITPRPRE